MRIQRCISIRNKDVIILSATMGSAHTYYQIQSNTNENKDLSNGNIWAFSPRGKRNKSSNIFEWNVAETYVLKTDSFVSFVDTTGVQKCLINIYI